MRKLTLLALLFCLSCNQPPAAYGIKGLSLPAGSTVIKRDERKTSLGKVDFVNVSFDSPGDWRAVQAHFDQQLTPLGFTADASGAATGMRMYMNLKQGTAVHLMDNSPVMTRAELDGYRGANMGRYDLVVMLP